MDLVALLLAYKLLGGPLSGNGATTSTNESYDPPVTQEYTTVEETGYMTYAQWSKENPGMSYLDYEDWRTGN
jgi:hypothetical protein